MKSGIGTMLIVRRHDDPARQWLELLEQIMLKDQPFSNAFEFPICGANSSMKPWNSPSGIPPRWEIMQQIGLSKALNV